MAKKHQPDHAPQKKTIFCFTASCFKFSDHIKSPQGKEKAETFAGKKNRRRWLCWSRRLPAAAKTVVPVDGSPAAASSAKSKKFQPPGYKGRSRDAEPPPCDTTAEESPDGGCRIQEKPTTKAVADHQNLAVETQFDPTEPATCPPTGRKLNAVRHASSSQPGSPDQIRRRVPGVRSAVMSPAFSSTVLGPIIKNPFSKTAAGKKLEPVVAMSVIMVTLLIMIMWGRLCAILCTSAWLYIIPKFRSRELAGSGELDSESHLDTESEEYKKKVVLEGLLHRSRRT